MLQRVILQEFHSNMLNGVPGDWSGRFRFKMSMVIAVELVVAVVGDAVKFLAVRRCGVIWLLAACAMFGCVWQAFAVQWDMTRFEYEPGTGRLVRKVYPDGKAISYAYYCEGLPKRITQASGKWMERFYDSRLNVTSNVYSSENTPDVHIVPNEFGTPLRVADVSGLVYEYSIRSKGQLLTNETVTSPWMDWTLGHSHDQFSRETGWTLSVDGAEKGRTTFNYDGNGKISQMECVNAEGRFLKMVARRLT